MTNKGSNIKNRVQHDDRKIVFSGFNLVFELNFSSSIPVSMKDDLIKYFGKGKNGRLQGISTKLKNNFLKEFEIKPGENIVNVNDLCKYNKNIRKAVKSLKEEILLEFRDDKELQEWFENQFNKFIEEAKKKDEK